MIGLRHQAQMTAFVKLHRRIPHRRERPEWAAFWILCKAHFLRIADIGARCRERQLSAHSFNLELKLKSDTFIPLEHLRLGNA